MNVCAGRDQDLLLLAHGALGPAAAFRTWLHTRTCPACRERYREFALVSTAMAGAVRPGLKPWSPRAIATTKTAAAAALAFAIVGGSYAVYVRSAEPATPAPSSRLDFISSKFRKATPGGKNACAPPVKLTPTPSKPAKR